LAIGSLAANGTEQSAWIGDETSLEDPNEYPQIVRIHSLYLRLTEVEFADVNVLGLRKNIDRLANKISTLKREYLKKQQELKIAEAESAWRSSWFEN
jgi:predicted translin family RNA/ssDNA-binding protein